MTLTLILSHAAAFVAGMVIGPALMWAIGALYISLLDADDDLDDGYDPL